MNKILILTIMILLTGCVRHHVNYPQVWSGDVYYFTKQDGKEADFKKDVFDCKTTADSRDAQVTNNNYLSMEQSSRMASRGIWMTPYVQNFDKSTFVKECIESRSWTVTKATFERSTTGPVQTYKFVDSNEKSNVQASSK